MPDTLDSINSTTIIYCFREAKFTKGSKRSRNKQSRRQERKEETRNRPHLPEVSEPGSCCSWIRIAERKKLSIHQGLPSPAQQSCCQTKRVGMKILSVVGTTQSCFHTERVGMKILSAIGAARSLALARWGFTKAMASGPWATQAKPQLPKNILCPQGKRYDERARECRQSAQAKGGWFVEHFLEHLCGSARLGVELKGFWPPR
jgi:hypothetical protein